MHTHYWLILCVTEVTRHLPLHTHKHRKCVIGYRKMQSYKKFKCLNCSCCTTQLIYCTAQDFKTRNKAHKSLENQVTIQNLCLLQTLDRKRNWTGGRSSQWSAHQSRAQTD